MKEFKGCKGPWVHHMPHGYQHYVGGWIQSEKGKVCDVAGLDVGRELAFANARLISSAPELLEALQLSLSAMNEMGDILNFHDIADAETVEKLTPAFEMARAAINKALGKEQP